MGEKRPDLDKIKKRAERIVARAKTKDWQKDADARLHQSKPEVGGVDVSGAKKLSGRTGNLWSLLLKVSVVAVIIYVGVGPFYSLFCIWHGSVLEDSDLFERGVNTTLLKENLTKTITTGFSTEREHQADTGMYGAMMSRFFKKETESLVDQVVSFDGLLDILGREIATFGDFARFLKNADYSPDALSIVRVTPDPEAMDSPALIFKLCYLSWKLIDIDISNDEICLIGQNSRHKGTAERSKDDSSDAILVVDLMSPDEIREACRERWPQSPERAQSCERQSLDLLIEAKKEKIEERGGGTREELLKMLVEYEVNCYRRYPRYSSLYQDCMDYADRERHMIFVRY